MSTLYIVGTPIGNLEDITLRAVRILKEVDVVLCEDTRVTKKLLSHFDIHTKTESFHAHSTQAKMDAYVRELFSGKNIAMVTDAGTPGISDPGSLFVEKVRVAILEKASEGDVVDDNDSPVKIESVPGVSAITTALSIAGLPINDFVFLGFLPHKKGRETLFKEIAGLVQDEKGKPARAVMFYESPHRILKTLEALQKQGIGKVTIARELTKIYEEVVTDTPEALLGYFEKHAEKVRGEFVVIVSPVV